MDIATNGNTNWAVKAVEGGTVKFSSWDNTGYGNAIIIEHKDGSKAIYAHLNSRLVNYNDPVSKGTTIGIAGSSGDSSGIHLHFEFSNRHAWTFYKKKYGFDQFQWSDIYPNHPTS